MPRRQQLVAQAFFACAGAGQSLRLPLITFSIAIGIKAALPTRRLSTYFLLIS